MRPPRGPSPRRVLLAIGAAGALALGVAAGSKSSPTGFAYAQVMLDTPTSQMIEAAPFGNDSLAWRASLLVHRMASGKVKQRVAAELGIAPDELNVVDPALSVPRAPASLPKAATEAAANNPAPYVLTAYLADELLPIISIEAQAPNLGRAAHLATAATDALKAQAQAAATVADVPTSVAASDAEQVIPRGVQGFVIDDVADLRVKEVEIGPGPVKATGLAIFSFGLWCAGLAVAPRLVRFARAHLPRPPRRRASASS